MAAARQHGFGRPAGPIRVIPSSRLVSREPSHTFHWNVHDAWALTRAASLTLQERRKAPCSSSPAPTASLSRISLQRPYRVTAALPASDLVERGARGNSGHLHAPAAAAARAIGPLFCELFGVLLLLGGGREAR